MNLDTTPELTIIVPVYKVEQYLKECIGSILSQTFADWELILVDDGSPDNSGAICDDYAGQDSRIKVIHKHNEGAGAARNTALEIARGRYITFIDSDDSYGLETTLEDNMAILEADSAIDCVQFPYVLVNDGYESLKTVAETRLASKEEILSYMLDERIKGYLWNKIFRAELLDGIRFPVDIKITEDLYFLIDAVERAEVVYISEHGSYRYYKRSGSLMASSDLEKETGCSRTFRKMLSVAERYPGVDSSALVRWVFMTMSHLFKIKAIYGTEIYDELEAVMAYMPDVSPLSGNLNLKCRLRLIQIRLFGFKAFARWNIFKKRLKYNALVPK